MIRKIAVLKFLEKHTWSRPLILWCAACQYLININSKAFLNTITYDAHHYQQTLISQYFRIWCFWNYFSFSFPVRNFFIPRNTLNPSHGLNYLENLHLFIISSSFRIQGLGIGITALYLNNFSRT